MAIGLSLLYSIIHRVNSDNLTDLATFHLSYRNTSHVSKPQKLSLSCWQVGRLNAALRWKWKFCQNFCEHAHRVFRSPSLLPSSSSPPLSAVCSCPPPTLGPILNLEIPHTRGTVGSWCTVCASQIDMHTNTHMPPCSPLIHITTRALPVILTSPEHVGPEEAPHYSPSTGAAWHCGYPNTLAGLCCFYLFFLCFLSIGVDNHPPGELLQEGSFFLPFQGIVIVSGQRPMCACTFLNPCA